MKVSLHILHSNLIKILKRLNQLYIYFRCYKFKTPYYVYRTLIKKEKVWYAIAKSKEMFPELEWGTWWIKIWNRRINADDPTILTEVLEVILPECIKYYNFKQKHDVILDIGAFIGETALYFIVSGQAKQVIAIEPVPRFAYLAEENTRGLPVKVLNLAISEQDTNTVTIKLCKETPAASRIDIPHNDTSVIVKAVNLDYLIRVYNPSAIKMDCEGCENSLLQIQCDTLKKVNELIVELHLKYVDIDAIRRKMYICGFREEVLVNYGSSIIIRYWH